MGSQEDSEEGGSAIGVLSIGVGGSSADHNEGSAGDTGIEGGYGDGGGSTLEGGRVGLGVGGMSDDIDGDGHISEGDIGEGGVGHDAGGACYDGDGDGDIHEGEERSASARAVGAITSTATATSARATFARMAPFSRRAAWATTATAVATSSRATGSAPASAIWAIASTATTTLERAASARTACDNGDGYIAEGGIFIREAGTISTICNDQGVQTDVSMGSHVIYETRCYGHAVKDEGNGDGAMQLWRFWEVGGGFQYIDGGTTVNTDGGCKGGDVCCGCRLDCMRTRVVFMDFCIELARTAYDDDLDAMFAGPLNSGCAGSTSSTSSGFSCSMTTICPIATTRATSLV